MRVILLQDVEAVGKRYEVKEVTDGYARNFLLPKNLAKPATKEAIQWLEMHKEIFEQKAEEELQKAQELASQLDDLEVVMNMKVGEEGQLFEAVTPQKIAERLKEMGYSVKKTQVQIDEQIKELGEYPVKIALDHNLEASLRIIVAEEE